MILAESVLRRYTAYVALRQRQRVLSGQLVIDFTTRQEIGNTCVEFNQLVGFCVDTLERVWSRDPVMHEAFLEMLIMSDSSIMTTQSDTLAAQSIPVRVEDAIAAKSSTEGGGGPVATGSSNNSSNSSISSNSSSSSLKRERAPPSPDIGTDGLIVTVKEGGQTTFTPFRPPVHIPAHRLTSAMRASWFMAHFMVLLARRIEVVVDGVAKNVHTRDLLGLTQSPRYVLVERDHHLRLLILNALHIYSMLIK